jgi:hypothetical protein
VATVIRSFALGSAVNEAFVVRPRFTVRNLTWLLFLGLSACGGRSESRNPPSVSASGGNGATGGTTQTATGGSSSGTETMPAAAVFADEQVIEYRLSIAPNDLAQLEEHGNLEVYLPAELELTGSEVGSLSMGSVGLRHKGAWSLHHCWDDFDGVRSYAEECAKLSYKIKFNEYLQDSRFEGLKQLNLHASSGDATKLRELLAYDTFRAFGVDAPRAAPAKVFVNGQFQGLFIAVEEIDGRYTKFHFPDGGDGNLYKEVWPRAGLSDQHFVDALKTNDEVPDVSDMQAFSAAIGATTEATFRADMQRWVDIDNLLRYVAVDRASKNWDGITAFYSPETSHNFYFYHDDGQEDRFHLIPWDLDNTFWEFDPYMAPEQWVTAAPLPDWNVLPASCYPMPVWESNGDTRVTPPGCDPFLQLLASTEWENFVTVGNELLAGPFKYETLLAKITHWASVLEPIIADDPYVNVVEWRQQKDLFPSILQRGITDFEAFLKKGYTRETPLPTLPEPTQSELDAPLSETGLVLDHVNNYEFIGGAANDPPAGVYWYGAEGVTGTPTWNTTSPESGTADLKFGFTFTRITGAWNEWVDVIVPTKGGQAFDISGYTQLSITLKTDSPRRVRVRLSSPAYEDAFNGAWKEFGTEFSVSTTPKTYKMRLDQLVYPAWAKDDWAGTAKGWTTTDNEALEIILQRFDGLLFAPQATTLPDGELTSASESSILQIDNIYFQ